MTNYGAIPTSPAVDVESLSNHNQCTNTTCAMPPPRRPWGVMFDVHSMGLPCSFSDASSRFKTNYNYFRMNYLILFAIYILILIYISFLKHPVSLMAFTVLVLLYIFLYNLHDDDKEEMIELFCCQISDWMIRTVKTCLILVTIALLIWTNETYKIFGWPLVIGHVVILIHAVVRKTDDLFLDEEAAVTMSETYWNSLWFHVMLALFNLYISFG